MSLAQLWATLRAARWSIVLMMLVATGVAYVVAAGLPKQYTAKARVMLNISNPDPAQFSALKRNTEVGYINTEMRLVVDDNVMRAVVTKLGWPDNPQVITAWQTATGGVGDITTWAAHQVAQNVNVQQLEDSSIIEIYYASSSLDVAKQIAALIRQAFIEQSLKLRIDAAQRASAWNQTQAAKALTALRQAEAERAAFMKANEIPLDTARGGLDYAAQAQALTASVAAGTAVAAATATGAPEDPSVTKLRRRLDGIDAEMSVLRLRGGEANPAVLALAAERANISQQLARELTVTRAGPSATDAQIGVVRQQRDADYLAARLRMIDRAPLYDRLATIDRDVAFKTGRYTAAMARIADFNTVAAAPSGLNVIGDVIASDDPSYPDIPLMLAIAAGSSFALAVSLALVRELIQRQVRGAEDLRFFAGAPLLAVIAPDAPRRNRWRAILARLPNWPSLRRRRRRDPSATGPDQTRQPVLVGR